MDPGKTRFTCPQCSVQMTVDTDIYNSLLESHKNFYCLNGHKLTFKTMSPKDHEIKKLKEKIEELCKALAEQCRTTAEQEVRANKLEDELYHWKPRDGCMN